MLQLKVDGGHVSSLEILHNLRQIIFSPRYQKTFHQWKKESSETKNNSLSQDSNKVLTCSHLVGSGHQFTVPGSVSANRLTYIPAKPNFSC